jgi:DNA-binding transcriptional MerR regulator
MIFHAGNTTKITELSYRQLDNIVRNRLLRPSRRAACGRGTVRSFSERDLIALRLTKEILGAGHRLGPFMHILRYVQHGRELPPLDQLEAALSRSQTM